MSDFVSAMAYPFLACLLLAGIHVYLGIHVVERKVIFVDLALAQIAALGSVVGLLLGYDAHADPLAMKGFSFLFAVFGAAVFSLTRTREERVPHEAVIGVIYAFALAASILISTRLAHGADEIRGLFTGSILWTDGPTLLYAGAIYGGVGLVHFLFRRRFLLVSLDPRAAEREGLDLRWWDFWFYLLFALVVTSSVGIAGVLLVFAYLVIPAVIAVLFAEGVRRRLVIGWALGALVSFAGVVVSYLADLPSGPVIVVAFTVALALAAITRVLQASVHRGRDAAIGAAGAVALAGLCLWLSGLGKAARTDLAALLAAEVPAQRLEAVRAVGRDASLWRSLSARIGALAEDPSPQVRSAVLVAIGARGDRSLLGVVHRHLRDRDDVVREAALRAVRALASSSSVEPLLEASRHETDGFLRVELAEALVELGEPRGLALLEQLARSAGPAQARAEAAAHLSHHRGQEPHAEP